MIKYLVNTRDKGLTSLETFPCRQWVKELCENRIFDSLQQLENLLLVVDVSEEAYDRGLGCPKDAKTAIETIKALPKFKQDIAYVCSKESGADVYKKLKELSKQGRILTWGRIVDPHPGDRYWSVEVITGIKEV